MSCNDTVCARTCRTSHALRCWAMPQAPTPVQGDALSPTLAIQAQWCKAHVCRRAGVNTGPKQAACELHHPHNIASTHPAGCASHQVILCSALLCCKHSAAERSYAQTQPPPAFHAAVAAVRQQRRLAASACHTTLQHTSTKRSTKRNPCRTMFSVKRERHAVLSAAAVVSNTSKTMHQAESEHMQNPFFQTSKLEPGKLRANFCFCRAHGNTLGLQAHQ